jgi:hypothetical protein
LPPLKPLPPMQPGGIVLCEDSCTARQFWIKASELATRHQREFPWRPGVPDSFLAALRHIFVRDGFCEDGGAGYARSSTGEWNEIDRITRGKVLKGEWTSPVGLRSPWHDYLNSLYATRSHQDALVLWLWRPSSEMQQRYEQHLGTLCEYGTDCSDCGPRVVYPPPPPHPPGERVRCHDACPCHHDGQCDDQDSSSCILNGAPHACEFGSDCALRPSAAPPITCLQRSHTAATATATALIFASKVTCSPLTFISPSSRNGQCTERHGTRRHTVVAHAAFATGGGPTCHGGCLARRDSAPATNGAIPPSASSRRARATCAP